MTTGGRCLAAGSRRAAFLHQPEDGGPASGLLEVRRSPDAPLAAEVCVLWVAPGARRQGTGRHLLAAADAWAGRVGCHELRLQLPLADADGQAAATALGFGETARTVGYARRVHAPMAVAAGAPRATGIPAGAPRATGIPAGAPRAPGNQARPPHTAGSTAAPVLPAPAPATGGRGRWLHGAVILAGVASLGFTDIFSNDPVRGGLLPLLDLLFLLYLAALYLGRRYRQRTDARERSARLFDAAPRGNRHDGAE